MNARVRLLCVVLSLLWIAAASAQDKVPPAPGTAPAPQRDPGVSPKSLNLPETVSPMVGFYLGADEKEKKVKLAFVESVAEMVTEVVKRGGKETVVEKTVYKPTAIAGSVPFADIQFYNTQGKKLTVESVVAKLKSGDTLVISGDERALGAAYLKVIHAEAIIAVFPLDPFIEPFVVAPADGPGVAAPALPIPMPLPAGPPRFIPAPRF